MKSPSVVTRGDHIFWSLLILRSPCQPQTRKIRAQTIPTTSEINYGFTNNISAPHPLVLEEILKAPFVHKEFMSPSIRIKMLSISSIGSAAGSSSRGAGDTKRHRKSEKQREDDLACNTTVTSSTLQQKSAGVTGSSESVASSSMKRDRNDTGVDPIERFQPVNERSLKTQFDCLTKRQRGCVEMIRQLWETDNRPLTSMDYLRFARFSNFNFRFCRKYLKRFDKRYLSLNVDFLKAQLKTHVSSENDVSYLGQTGSHCCAL